MKNSQFTKENNSQETTTKPFNNIILPIANVNYRTEGFNVKDIELYVDDKDYFHLSFLAKKYYSKWAIENKIDTAIDESVESYFDYGLTLIKNVFDKRPEVVQLQQIAFCDQTDILSGPICLKHQFTIDQLMDMKGKWYEKEIDKALLMARFSQKGYNDQEAKTPGKYIEVYELHGTFPESWLGEDVYGDSWEDTGKYSKQIHIITYYVNETDSTKSGLCLFKGKEAKPIFKAIKRDDIYGRACGRGGIEELFHPQIWTNYSEQHMQQMLEAVSKVIMKTSSKKLKNQKLSNLKHGQILDVDREDVLEQVAITAPNKQLFDNFVNKWEQVARTIGSASDPQLGLNPTSGTPLGTTEIVTAQGEGVHEYRQGKISTFWHEIHDDWVIEYLQRDLNRGDEWLDELSIDELQEVAERVAINQSNNTLVEMILSGKTPTPEDQELMKSLIKEQFMKGGKKRFLKVMKDEFKQLPLKIRFNIAGKQKNLAEVVSKLNSVFRTVFTPGGVEMIQSNPGVGDLLNEILELSGLSPVNFSSLTVPQAQSQLSPMQGMQEQPSLTA